MTDAQSAHLKGRFLEHFAKMGNVSAACRAAKVGRRTIYDWQEHDDDFANRYREADIIATEYLEQEAYRRAVVGVKRTKGVYYEGEVVGTQIEKVYSDTLLIVLLKARAPDKYRERLDVNHSGTVVKAVDREFWEAM